MDKRKLLNIVILFFIIFLLDIAELINLLYICCFFSSSCLHVYICVTGEMVTGDANCLASRTYAGDVASNDEEGGRMGLYGRCISQACVLGL